MSFAFGHLVGAWLAGKIYEYFSKKKTSHAAWFFLLLGLGILTHFFLDSFSSHGVPLFWPSSLYFSWFNGLVPYSGEGSLLLGSAALLQSRLKYAVADMAIGTAWIFYLWFKKRIQF